MPVLESAVRRSSRVYGGLLAFYPRGFRREFGDQMLAAFDEWIEAEAARTGARGVLRVWLTTAGELGPTLFREHAEAMRARPEDALASLGSAARVLAACAVPAGAFAWLQSFATRPGEMLVLANWCLLTAAGMWLARGRGWACSRNAMLASAAGVWLPILWEAATRTSTPNVLWVAPLLLAAAATAGLILSAFVRVIIEGVSFDGSPRTVAC